MSDLRAGVRRSVAEAIAASGTIGVSVWEIQLPYDRMRTGKFASAIASSRPMFR